MYIVIGIIGLIVVGIIAYYMARFMKGKMSLQLNGNYFKSGETIEGTLTVETKKAIPVDRMYVAVVGERLVHRRDSDGDTSKRWEEFHRDEYDIIYQEHLRANARESYEFAIEAPDRSRFSFPETGVAFVDKMVSGLQKLSGSGKMRWFIKARLETKGVDLATSEKIKISTKQV